MAGSQSISEPWLAPPFVPKNFKLSLEGVVKQKKSRLGKRTNSRNLLDKQYFLFHNNRRNTKKTRKQETEVEHENKKIL